MPLNTGDVFAGYTIQRWLGSGGMGEVYLARHPRLSRLDALKILPTSLTDNPQYRQRFNREAEIAGSLWHPHIVGLHDRGETDGQLWIAMDYVDGTDASRLVRELHPDGLPVREAIEIVAAIAEALDYAHSRNLLHRDVKPSNILLTRPDAPRRRILLADFGVARRSDDISGLTATNMTVGSMAYSPPEQLLGQPMDGRADQYALAANAFQLLTGQSPFQHSNPAVMISKHLNEPPPRPSASRADLAHLDAVLARALAKDAGARYPNCGDFARAFATAATSPVQTPTPAPAAPPPVIAHPVAAPVGGSPGWPPPPLPQPSRPRGRDTARAVITAALSVILLCAIGFAASQFIRPAPETPSTPQWEPYVEAAKDLGLNLVTVSADSVDADIQRVLDASTGQFHDEFSQGAAELKQQTVADRIEAEGTVAGAGIEAYTPEGAMVLVAVKTQTTDKSSPGPVYRVERLLINVAKVDDGYRASTVVNVK
ncbi:serine/threonine-protein kinase [Mycobacterium sp. NPDC003449]